MKPRLDELIVSRGLATDLREARGKILAGEILSGDQRMDKAGVRLATSTPLRWRPRRGHGYVGRGGLKMESALRQLNIDPSGLTCLDLGMSTGGFTDCLLQWGATQVYGVDVGVGLAHHRLVTDPRVHIIEGTHTKDLTREHIPVPCDICVADISFNALARVVEPATQFLKRGATGILLVKPQFELSASEVNSYGDRGVITDPEAQLLALERSIASITSSGWKFLKSIKSETKGSKGNQEFFLHLEWSGST